MAKYYSYFFTRQDISPEQQIVQTAHAALKLGVLSQTVFDSQNTVSCMTRDIDPDETYFTVVGVRNLDALCAVQEILDEFKYAYEYFAEPDMNNEVTSIALYPVSEYDRGPLLAFDLLKISA